MKKNNIIKYIFIFLGLAQLVSCSSWLDVPSKDKIMENNVFDTKDKFLSTLNGVYLELVSNSLYGKHLSYGMLDVMGQYYNTPSGHLYYSHSQYDYAQSTLKSNISSIWSKSYDMIINCNTIIEKCDEKGEILGSELRPIVKGEALALRAMLHFDVLRLFGPIYNESSKNTECIPYSKSSAVVVRPLESAEKIASYIIKDLEESLALLANDPVLTEGALNHDNPSGGANDLFYRQYRLNYFAVKGLLARVYQWIGNKPMALKYVKEVVEICQTPNAEGEMLFPSTPREFVTHPTYPDRIFHTETLFGLYNMSRKSVYNESFAHTLPAASILTFAGTISSGRVAELFSDQNDYRYRSWTSKVAENQEVVCWEKYIDVTGNGDYSTSAFRYMMPLITINEMYLIAAECVTIPSEAIGYYNKVRASRNCINFAGSDNEIGQAIIEEFRREMLGMGQMFFMYKRLAMESIPDGSQATGNKNMPLGSYVLPLPDAELSQRN